MSKPVVLIVDDAPANIQVLAACLMDDYSIKVATSGYDCLELMAKQSLPDLVLLDIEMPGMNGYEVCQRLKSDVRTKDIPIIFVTAKDEAADEEKGLTLGAVDYIPKPIRPAIVVARVNTHVTLKQQRDMLKSMALHDHLTGLYNRHYLIEATEQKMSDARRHGGPLSLLIIDVDHFKKVNDSFGHIIGDTILKSVSGLLSGQCRREDIAARFGGEEFIMLLCHCNADSAREKAEKLRHALSDLKPDGHNVTVSIGVTELRDDDSSVEQIIERADEALYRAKESGRNRVEVV